jgi:GTP-binding protein LepA
LPTYTKAIDNNHENYSSLKQDRPACGRNPNVSNNRSKDVIGLDASDAILASAKSRLGIQDVLEAIVTRLPAPTGDESAALQAMLVDSWYDPYLGVMILVRIKNGVLSKGMKIRMMSTGASYEVDRVGYFTPKQVLVDKLLPGEVGFITASIKAVADCKVGDTVTEERRQAAAPLPGFKPSVPVVFCGLFPVDAADFERLRDSLAKLQLNDASFHYEAESSARFGLWIPLWVPGSFTFGNHSRTPRARI